MTNDPLIRCVTTPQIETRGQMGESIWGNLRAGSQRSMWGRSVDFHEMFFRPLPIIFMKQPNGNRKILILIRTWKVLRRYRSTDMCFRYVIHSQYCRAESISCVEWRRPYSLCMVYNCGVAIIKLRRVTSAVCGNVWRTYSRYMAFACVFFFFFFFCWPLFVSLSFFVRCWWPETMRPQ